MKNIFGQRYVERFSVPTIKWLNWSLLIFFMIFFLLGCAEEGPSGTTTPESTGEGASRIAKVNLTLSDTTGEEIAFAASEAISVDPGEEITFDASESVYDEIFWEINGSAISECEGNDVCTHTHAGTNEHEIVIRVIVNSTEATSEDTADVMSVTIAGSDSDTTNTDLSKKIIFVSNTTADGSGVDTLDCSADANNPNGGTYSALITTEVIQADTIYTLSDGITVIGTSDSTGDLTISTAVDSGTVWTGMETALSTGNQCQQASIPWNKTNGNGFVGDAGATGSTAFNNGNDSCSNFYPVYCVQQ